jgi:hypothetical protein
MSLFPRTGSLFQNALINGNFDINQRGTTAVTGNGLFASDRWKTYYDGAGTVAAQVITNEGDELGSNNLKLTLTTTSSTANFYIFQSLETINSIPFRGKTVTFSCLLKKNAAFSSGSMSITLTTGTGVDQSYGNGGLAANRIVASSELSSSAYQKFSVTGIIPINTNQITVWITLVSDGTYTCGPDTSAIQVKQCQLNEGSVALPFQPRHYGEELALCMRYYEITDTIIGPTIGSTAQSAVTLTTTFKVTKRASPTSCEVYDLTNNAGEITTWWGGISTNNVTPTNKNLILTSKQNTVYQASANLAGIAYYCKVDAEL